MITNTFQLCCGGCGHHGFRIFADSDERLMSECMQCKSMTFITITQPRISLQWGDNADGILTRLPEKVVPTHQVLTEDDGHPD